MKEGWVVRYPGCVMAEVEPVMALLKDRVRLRVVDLEEIDPNETPHFLILPGGACDAAVTHRSLHAVIREVDERGGVLAGMCNGAMVLASAGILRGRTCTHTAHPRYASGPVFEPLLKAARDFFQGTYYIDEDLVVSEHVVTAKPWAAVRFASAVAERLGLSPA